MQSLMCRDRLYKRRRRMMAKWRGGTAELGIETGTYMWVVA